MAAAGVPVAPGTTDPAADRRRGGRRRGRDRLPGDGQGRRRRRRHGHGAWPPTRPRCAPSTTRCAAFAERMFGDGSVLIERYFPRVRHVEVQILGLADGRVVALGERECSVQRRNQKLVEESPSPAVSPRAARAAAGRGGAGRRGGRLPQRRHGRVPARPGHRRVLLPGDEHPAAGRAPGHRGGLRRRPGRGAAAGRRPAWRRPSTRTRWPRAGTPSSCGSTPRTRSGSCPARARSPTWVEPTGEGVRVDSGYAAGTTVTPVYDSLMAKLIVHGADRAEALARARAAVAGFEIAGPEVQPAVLRRAAGQRRVRLRRLRHRHRRPDALTPCGRDRASTVTSTMAESWPIERCRIREVGPRDGLQNEDPVPTEPRSGCSTRCPRTGVGRIEAVSFVHPKAIPQMADADEVWAAGARRRRRCATRRWCPTRGAPSGRSPPASPRSRSWSRPATRTTGATSTGPPTSRSTTSPS